MQPAPIKEKNRTDNADTFVNSLEVFVGEVARAIEEKVSKEKLQGPIRIEVSASRGISEKGLLTAFQPRLRIRLRNGRVALPASRSAVHCRITVSRDKDLVWAVGVIEGARMVGPSPFAVSYPMDKSLEAIFGKEEQGGQTTWRWNRIGGINGGALDALAYDLDQDGIDELVVLSVEGIQAYRIRPADFKPEKVWGPFPFPHQRIWPRPIAGWIALREDKKFHIATSAGHSYIVTYPEGQYKKLSRSLIPLRQPQMTNKRRFGQSVFFQNAFGGVAFQASTAIDQDGRSLRIKNVPERLRYLLRFGANADSWMWVNDHGRLFMQSASKAPHEIKAAGVVGDRFLTGDFDVDGRIELMVTSGSQSREGDGIKVYTIGRSGKKLTERFQANLTDGFVRAMAVGSLDLDERPDMVIIESTEGPKDILWRLEYAP